MYAEVDEWINCGNHGKHVRGAIHLYVENGDPNNPEHAWLVCLACARRMDRDPKFKRSKRANFDEYQRHVREYLAELKNADGKDGRGHEL